METRYLKFVTLLIITTFVIFGCKTTKIPKITKIVSSQLIEIGEYKLLQESLSKIPYLNKNVIIFQDLQGNQQEFTISESDLFKTDSAFLYKYDVIEAGDTITYQYTVESKRFYIKNKELDIIFSFNLRATPYRKDPETRYVADVVEVGYSKPNNNNSSRRVFFHVLNQRSWPEINSALGGAIMKHSDTVKILDKDFYNVYSNEYYQDPKLKIYFNYEFGILSFTDRNNKLWRFKSFK